MNADPDAARGPVGPPPSWAVLFFVVLTVACTWPLARDAQSYVQDRGDPLLEIAALAWGTHALVTPGAPLLTAPQHYPYRLTQMYQNSFFGQVPLFAPVWWATGNPVLAFQCTLLAALFLSGLCMWAYVRRLTNDSAAGLLAGAVFAFHQYRFRNLQHLQVQSIWWWPLALWGLEDFLATRRWRALTLLAIAGVAQVYCSVYMGAMLALVVGVRVLVELIAEPPRLRDRVLWRRALPALGVALALVAPLAVPYARVARQFPAVHDLQTIAHFSAAPRDYLRLGLSSVPYYWLRAREPWHFTFDQWVLFPGFVCVALAVYGVARTETVARAAGDPAAPTRRLAFGLVAVALVGVVLSFGPYLKLGGRASDLPLPALVLLEHLPGYRMFRVNTRFAFLLLPALSIGVGLAFRTIADRRGYDTRRRRRLFLAILAAFLLENWNAPVPTAAVPVGRSVPPVYRALAEAPDGGPILEVPFGRSLYEDIARVYFGLTHWRRLVNGYSTVVPPGYRELVELGERGPTDPLFHVLAAWDVRTLVVHYSDMGAPAVAQWRAAADRPDVQVRQTFPDSELWTLTTRPRLVDAPELALETREASAGGDALLRLHFTTPAGTVWRCPAPLGLRPATVTWQPIDSTAAVVEQHPRALLPLYAVWAQDAASDLHVPAPGVPGRYRVRVDCGVAVADVTVDVTPRRDAGEPDQTAGVPSPASA